MNTSIEHRVAPVKHIMQTDVRHARLPHAAEYEGGAAFSGGRYSPIQDATVPMLDMGFRNADATYDVVSVSRGMFFRLDYHLDRMDRSTERFRLRSPYDRARTVEILTELLRLAGLRDAYVWWAVTRGVARPGAASNRPSAYENRFYAFVMPYSFIADDEMRQRGFDMMISRQYLRIPTQSVDSRAKNFHWMDLRQSIFEAAEAGHQMPVLCDSRQMLAECPGANIFVLAGGRLMTPAQHCLEGGTRQSVLDLAAEIRVPTFVGDIPASTLRGADEVFITSTAGGIMPVTRLEGQPIGQGTPGPITTLLHNLYWEKRWAGWHGTPVRYERG